MNREALQQRLKEIEAAIVANERQLQQLSANLNVLIGGREEVRHWLNQCSEPLNLQDVKQMLGADSIELIDKPA